MESNSPQTKDLQTFLKILDDRWPGENLRVDTEGKTFDLADCDAAGFLFNLKTAGKRPDSAWRASVWRISSAPLSWGKSPTEKIFNHKGHKGHIVGARFIAPSGGGRGSFSRKERKGRKKE